MVKDKFFVASIDQNINTIDLHDTGSVGEALDKLEQELFFLQKKDTAYCRVVYGIGEGILQEAVLEALGKNPIVQKSKDEGASCLVLL
jgi:dsDNA-specific endonuclease/ATPase MutS2